MSWTADLANEITGQVLTDRGACDAASTDFGGIVVRKPRAVVRPSSAVDVARVLKYANRQSLRVAVRGCGHSQSGQSLSEDIVVDTTSLDRFLGKSDSTITAQAGATWRSLLSHLAAERLCPPVLTNNLDVTVGGTLSMGGLGVASWRHGTQADNCLELEVATGEGEIVRCSDDANRELFDSVRAGAGQFGVITEAVLKVRPHAPGFRSFYLLYDDLAALLDDLRVIMADERFDHLEAWCAPCPQGFKQVGQQRQAFAQWFYPLHATIEAAEATPPAAAEKLAGLKFYKHVHTEDGDMLRFFTRLDDLFALWKRGGFWDYAHPWMECVLPWATTQMFISQVLGKLPPQALVGGHILLWPARGTASSVPLFMRPSGEFLMGFGILPAVPQRFLGEVLPSLKLASDAAKLVGGKRYLSGWLEFDPARWKAHFGDRWPALLAAKKKFDPLGVLNQGFVAYD